MNIFLNKIKLFNLKYNYQPIKLMGGLIGALISVTIVSGILSILEQPKYPFDFIDGEVAEDSDTVAENT